MTTRLYIFDADGTLRTTTVPGQPCPRAGGEWRLLADVRDRIAALPADALFGAASNQDQVGYGHLDERTARALLRDLMREATGRVLGDAALQLCPHVLEVRCACRKPGIAMLERLLAFYRVAPEAALFVGDAECDRQAAARAGVPFQWAHVFFRRDQP
jgi:D-glycero-D-manno-heptose 1,7-bisphosphate phosphatase